MCDYCELKHTDIMLCLWLVVSTDRRVWSFKPSFISKGAFQVAQLVRISEKVRRNLPYFVVALLAA